MSASATPGQEAAVSALSATPLTRKQAKSIDRPRQSGSATAAVPTYIAVAVALALIGLPLVWMLLATMKSRPELIARPVEWLPAEFRTMNFREAWRNAPFPEMYLTSIVTTTVSTLLKVCIGVTTAYALVFLKFPGRTLIFWFVLASLMVPFEVVIIPNFLTVADLKWVYSDSLRSVWLGIVVPGLGTAFGAFLMRQTFRQIPHEIVEAAQLDGVSRWGLLWKVVVPMSRPSIVAFALITAVAKWNEYLWPRMIVNNIEKSPLPVGLTILRNSEGITNYGPIMAGTVLAILPVVPLMIIAQRHLVAGLTGGVKG